MRSIWIRGLAAVLALTVFVQLVPGVADLPVGASPAWGDPVEPVPPPGAVDPDPYMWVVEDSGPTQVSGAMTTDTVWGPQGSPYVVGHTTRVAPGATLTLLPGTVVKMGEGVTLTVEGQLLALGTPENRVVVTSIRDDTVMGDTNGDGDATSPALGDWRQIDIAAGSGQPVSMLDYVDFKYGGSTLESCTSWAAVNMRARAVVANSRFVEVQTGVRITGLRRCQR